MRTWCQNYQGAQVSGHSTCHQTEEEVGQFGARGCLCSSLGHMLLHCNHDTPFCQEGMWTCECCSDMVVSAFCGCTGHHHQWFMPKHQMQLRYKASC